jgi:predicted YcjX-like family ATPase
MQVGITGIANGGKTVFLSSLLWQLAERESAEFELNGIRVDGFSELPARSGDGVTEFPFKRYRDSLAHSGQWPEKTTDCFRYACSFKRSDWKRLNFGRLKRLGRLQHNEVQRLRFFDFPGERIADAAIAAFDDYAAWSDHMLHHFQSHQDYRAALTPYLKLLDELGEESEEERSARIVHAYKLVLAGLVHGYKPLISPSTFLLDQKGNQARPASDEALASSRICGLDADRQFAPLPESVRSALPRLAKQMAKHYRAYRRQLAAPLFEEIGRSRCLIVLVDIPSLLAGGVGRYNDNRQIVLDLFDALRPDSSLGGKLWNLLTFWKGSLKRVAFVAAKADLVDPVDMANGRLESLLRQMTTRASQMLPNMEFDWFVCSAIRSTRAGSKPGTLVGRPVRNNPEGAEMEYAVSGLPERWPDDWAAGDFRFPNVLPEVPKNLQIPPSHLGLDRLFNFLIR